jgi:hypothetical protein
LVKIPAPQARFCKNLSQPRPETPIAIILHNFPTKTLDIAGPTPNIQNQVGLFDEFTRKQFNRRL